MPEISPKFDFTGIDVGTIDPDRLSLGTGLQDCALIASTYERGAHSTPTEAAVLSTLSRFLQNKKQISSLTAETLSSYVQSPQETSTDVLKRSSQTGLTQPSGTTAVSDSGLVGLALQDQNRSSFGDSFGSKLLDKARNCIPCGLRMVSFMEMVPHLDLLDYLKNFIKNALADLNKVLSLLNNFDAFGDFCNLLSLLSFMCIPDLQRIIATLMALFTLQIPSFDSMIGILQSLIGPMFAPILMSITSLLDQFVKLVTGPLQCVIDAINAQLKSRSLGQGYYAVPGAGNSNATQIGGGLDQLNRKLVEAKMTIEGKMNFYLLQVKAMLGEISGGDAAYIQAKTETLNLVRMISFVIAILTALTKGHAACDTSKSPEQSEMDNFMQNFLSPQTPFDIYIDPQGNLQLAEKNQGGAPSDTPSISIQGSSFIDNTLIQQIQDNLTKAMTVPSPCQFNTTPNDADRINAWIAQLNQL